MSQTTLLAQARQLQAAGGVLDRPQQDLARKALSAHYNLSTAPAGTPTKALRAVRDALTPGPAMVTTLTKTVAEVRPRKTPHTL